MLRLDHGSTERESEFPGLGKTALEDNRYAGMLIARTIIPTTAFLAPSGSPAFFIPSSPCSLIQRAGAQRRKRFDVESSGIVVLADADPNAGAKVAKRNFQESSASARISSLSLFWNRNLSEPTLPLYRPPDPSG